MLVWQNGQLLIRQLKPAPKVIYLFAERMQSVQKWREMHTSLRITGWKSDMWCDVYTERTCLLTVSIVYLGGRGILCPIFLLGFPYPKLSSRQWTYVINEIQITRAGTHFGGKGGNVAGPPKANVFNKL